MQAYIATTFFGLENVLAKELSQLGAQNIQPLKRAVRFEANPLQLYKANMGLRTALHILHPLAEEKVRNADQLYALGKAINWMRWFNNEATYAIRARVSQAPEFKSPLFAALKLKDAIADQFRDFTGSRPNIDRDNPDIEIHLHIFKDRCSISIDSSGSSLHRRGYRRGGHAAPMNEVLAAGMLLLSDWRGQGNLVDFMCGSGTILTEGALLATNKAPNLLRPNFSLKHWKNFDKELWSQARMELMSEEKTFEHRIYGSDFKRSAISEAFKNAHAAGVADLMQLENLDFRKLKRPEEGEAGAVIINPPYGERLKPSQIGRLYAQIGDALKKHFSGYSAWILSSNREATKEVGLRPKNRIPLYNGPLECRLLQYDLYDGSKYLEKKRQAEKENEAPKKEES
ncbi:THUMP domain-containing protein [Saprospira sp. CCB-QB6]|uniref:THUMP domain-containing class I SAM-dependent RNA methyltransferase n=1 Tax=Saprospira sp. CCB-QB6 TaxID=3023936 RepID=UPI00234A80FF|nr:THUMP domain-containing protein [Saprospira sp. CCB-QB6]WCL82594.1 THUMP domain-containing protein [Saprospira sp. CCB-QB6]